MKLETKFQEVIEIQESDILSFEQGLPGFEHEKQFVLLPIVGTELSLLQSIGTRDLAFITTDPFQFFKTYDFELSKADIESLKLENEKDVFVQVIITVQDPYEKSTANLQAPVVINSKNNLCKQVILTDNHYRTRHKLTESLVRQEG
ncbi:flagellar assembly protein FliW [Fictibacillus sp. b24]|uniref:flagellar assembly protein FliW n=1 Tax=Fictibacillus sp. b24 TaxID=3055863 RepID=UPI0025A0F674|nr:flagellar assembly protein FliW [Fictibacillus sp. b24]MDM5315080.1 flagellar assembly protein FliW [Fictibacillus sp. b24]